MKNLLLALLFLLIPMAGFGQQETAEKSAEHYLRKSKVQKTLGTVVLSVGAASAIWGTALFIDDSQNRDDIIDGFGREAGTAFIIVGILIGGTSYFFYRASKKNRERYNGLQPAVGMIRIPATNQSAPTVGIAINF